MKFLLAISALLAASGPALAQTNSPRTIDLAKLGSSTEAATTGTTWSQLDDTSRYLLIMGSADGFSAGGAGAPCFPGRDNSSLDKALRDGGFSNEDPKGLGAALRRLSDDPAKCMHVNKRTYTVGLLKNMPDQHLAIYLTGLVRAYGLVKSCPEKVHPYAAASVSAAIFSSTDEAELNQVLPAALVEGCQGQPSN